jgi:glycosyltransferase involved in cell wall biosynthesis
VFSVVIPIFNAGKYLERAIASVLRQTLEDFELILVDDGSTDDAVDRARLIKDDRITILAQPNAGAPSALNRGVAAARGEYIAFLDCDDFWAPDKLQIHTAFFLAHPEADVIFSGLIYVDSDDKPLGLPARTSSGNFNFEQIFVDNVVGSSSVISIRKEAMHAAGGFDPAMLYLFDIDLMLRIALLRPSNVLGIPKPLAFYRRHPGQQTSDWRIIKRYWTKLVEKLRVLEPVQVKQLERAAQSNMTRYFSYLAFEQGDPSTAWSFLRGAYQENPIGFAADLRNWKLSLACGAALLLPAHLYRWLATQAGLRHVLRRPKAA